MTPKIDNGTTKRPIGVMSIDVKTVYDMLRRCEIGDTVTYEDMEKSIGRSVRYQNRWILSSACRRLLAQDSMLFGTVSKVGVKRLSDSEIVGVGQDTVQRIHRSALRGTRKLSAIRNYDGLSKSDKVRHGVQASALGILAHVTKERQLRRIEAKIENDPMTLPLQKTLEAFKES